MLNKRLNKIIIIFFICIFNASPIYGKNIVYKHVAAFPEIENQIVICNSGSKFWIEIIHYEFVVNKVKSNQLVKIYIGDVDNVDELSATSKLPIEIYDPKPAFAFTKAIIGLVQNFPKNSKLKLVGVLQTGYEAANRFLMSSDSSQSPPVCVGDPSAGIMEVYKSLHQNYINNAKRANRPITDKEIIKKRKTQGLIAYYPNPAYLKDHVEIGDLKWADYIGCYEFVTKSSGSSYNIRDEYTKSIKKLYPDNSTNQFFASDFKRRSGYFFRSIGKTADEICDAKGMWPRAHRQDKYKNLSIEERKRALLSDEEAWVLENHGNKLGSSGAYVATSHILAVTKHFGKHVYVIYTEGGIELPEKYGGINVYNSERETVIPNGTGWENVIGVRTRERKENNIFIGPVFLKSSLVENDEENFWEILNILGGKPQCLNTDWSEVTKSCTKLLDNNNEKNIIEVCENFMTLYYDDDILNDENLQKIVSSHACAEKQYKEKMPELCSNIMDDIAQLEFYKQSGDSRKKI